MRLLDLIHRSAIPLPWDEGDNIPWHDAEFSERMLKEHFSQAHDAASRRVEKIEAQVDWIHHELLAGHPTRILDLGCGPGLYTSRLAALGHECLGIDYSPASIAYARDFANKENLDCTYHLQDIRQVQYGSGFGLVMLIFGELNVFRPADVRTILKKAHRALADKGLLLLEPSAPGAIERVYGQASSWYSARSGLFGEAPHLCLQESHWDADSKTATIRYFVVDAASGSVTRHAQSLQSYTCAEYRSLLAECGFVGLKFFPSLTGEKDETQSDLIAIVARK